MGASTDPRPHRFCIRLARAAHGDGQVARVSCPIKHEFGISRSRNRQEILDRLRRNERALRERGVTHVALFGSRARGLKHYIASLLDGRADVVNRDTLKSYLRPAATDDAVYGF
jgi:uncharacterized protein